MAVWAKALPQIQVEAHRRSQVRFMYAIELWYDPHRVVREIGYWLDSNKEDNQKNFKLNIYFTRHLKNDNLV